MRYFIQIDISVPVLVWSMKCGQYMICRQNGSNWGHSDTSDWLVGWVRRKWLLNYQPWPLGFMQDLTGWVSRQSVVLDQITPSSCCDWHLTRAWPWPAPHTHPGIYDRPILRQISPSQVDWLSGPETIIIICSSKHVLLLDIGANQPRPTWTIDWRDMY